MMDVHCRAMFNFRAADSAARDSDRRHRRNADSPVRHFNAEDHKSKLAARCE